MARLFQRIDLVELLLMAFGAAERPPLRQRIDAPDGRELLVMPAISDRFAGVKILTITPENAGTGRPSIQGLFTLFDLATGVPLATIDADALTGHRTAAVSAAAASRLARPDATRLALLGSGHLIPYLAAAHASVRPIGQVRVWARNVERCRQAVAQVRKRLPGVEIEVAADLEAAVGWGDIVCSATRATQPLIQGRWLRAGTHVDLVGGYRPDMREIDDDGIALCRIFVDTREGALAEAGDLIAPLRDGVITPDAILGDLATLASRAGQRRNGQEITLFKSVGTATADLLAAGGAWETYRASAPSSAEAAAGQG